MGNWFDWFYGTGLSHQTTVPLVLSDLLAQAVQLQLMDLQVGPEDKHTMHSTRYGSTRVDREMFPPVYNHRLVVNTYK